MIHLEANGLSIIGFLTIFIILYNTDAKSIYRKTIIKYPQDTEFWATDFFVKGCKNFLDRCPKAYKLQPICARSYDGNFLDFNNYCEMQYENCNTWKNWYVYKRERC
ncbi:hypothetical protein B5X24_HaOG202245 [Helicoverpa armigera]|uniref:Kazal-like domain-containing protein n=1 Tax=Helicoverpa armigera TaxID=29058 RepID=A0A2W1BTG0_HELAM|nr:hypothetical protein B5X24_HaOG202245 [Helicoverpa armigera]